MTRPTQENLVAIGADGQIEQWRESERVKLIQFPDNRG